MCVTINTIQYLFKDHYNARINFKRSQGLKKHLQRRVLPCCDFELHVRDGADVAYIKPALTMNPEWSAEDRLQHLFVIGQDFTFEDASSMYEYLYDCEGGFPFVEDDFPRFFKKTGKWLRVATVEEPLGRLPRAFIYDEEHMGSFLRANKKHYIPQISDFPPIPLHKNEPDDVDAWQNEGLSDNEEVSHGRYGHELAENGDQHRMESGKRYYDEDADTKHYEEADEDEETTGWDKPIKNTIPMESPKEASLKFTKLSDSAKFTLDVPAKLPNKRKIAEAYDQNKRFLTKYNP